MIIIHFFIAFIIAVPSAFFIDHLIDDKFYASTAFMTAIVVFSLVTLFGWAFIKEQNRLQRKSSKGQLSLAAFFGLIVSAVIFIMMLQSLGRDFSEFCSWIIGIAIFGLSIKLQQNMLKEPPPLPQKKLPQTRDRQRREANRAAKIKKAEATGNLVEKLFDASDKQPDEMICASCGGFTKEITCVHCGESALLNGEYRLEALLGEGGHGSVFRARSSKGELSAIKRFRMATVKNIQQWEALDREIRVMQSLEHPDIPKYLDHFRLKAGPERYLCLVQEFVRGMDLNDLMNNQKTSPEEVMEVVADMAEIMAYLHGLNPPVIHRDIKPGNIMVRDTGELVLIDFGCVRESALKTFGATMGVGTFAYMAPEQFSGDISPASDIYSLGQVAVHMLTGSPPHPKKRWKRPDNVHTEIYDFVDTMVADESEERPTASEIAERARLFSTAKA